MSHQTTDATFEPDESGFQVPRCSCGWAFGPVPDTETLVDVLMAHAFDAGWDAHREETRET